MQNTSRLINRAIPRLSAIKQTVRPFHATAFNMVKQGDAIPSVELFETTPGTKVDLSKELTGKGVIVGVPAAFSMYIFSYQFPLSSWQLAMALAPPVHESNPAMRCLMNSTH